jgi:hypothetical protein
MLVCGVDVGNSTTELAFARVVPGSPPEFLLVLRTSTTGPKGSLASGDGVRELVERGARRIGERPHRLLMAELRPVETGLHELGIERELQLGRTAIARPSSATPSGSGVGAGRLRRLADLQRAPDGPAIAVVLDDDFDDAAAALRAARDRGWRITAAIASRDDGVLIGNRFDRALPIVDEVADAGALPVGELAAVEVAPPGETVQELADPLRVAAHLDLSPEEARGARNAARALAGHRAAIVVRRPAPPSNWTERDVQLHESGSDALDTFTVPLPAPPEDAALRLRLIARDAWGVAVLREAPAADLADALGAEVVCSEGYAAVLGASTTPRAGSTPLVLDLGGGTVDLYRADRGVTLAGAGELVTRICGALLGAPPALAERAKRARSVRVETPFVLHHEDSSRTFLGEPAPPATVGRLCIPHGPELVALPAPLAPEVWGGLRRRAKRDVLGANVRRAIDRAGGVEAGELVTLVGGCAADREVVDEVSAELAALDVAVARGDVLGRHGPRAAVAVGLVLASGGRR